MKFGLENISRLCAALGHPGAVVQSILIAGTNGKGSVTAMVHRGAAGGRATTPRATPRPISSGSRSGIVIGDREVDTARARSAIERDPRGGREPAAAPARLEAPPTFFECATAIAFDLFREAGVEVAVLEVGLGGRLDATNVVTPIVTAITSIGFDHQAQLGDEPGRRSPSRRPASSSREFRSSAGELPAEAERVIAGICRRARRHRSIRVVGVPATSSTAIGDSPRWPWPAGISGATPRSPRACSDVLGRPASP